VTPFAKKSAAVVFVTAAAVASPFASGCSSTPVNVPVRTFERAQRVDVMCLQVFAENPIGSGLYEKIPARPLPQSACAPVPVGVDGSTLPNHLYAFVTQTSRGEVALVDLTAGVVVDEDRTTPGINFIPVGALPTDVAVSHDGAMAFVSSAEPNKAAIYGIPAQRALGDTQFPVPADFDTRFLAPLTLPMLPACSLPQTPIALSIVPRGAGAEGGAGVGYEVAAVLAGTGGGRAKVVTIDPQPMLRGANPDDAGAGATIHPGSLEPCPVTSVIDLGDATLLPKTFVAGKPWDDGVKYVDGGVDLRGTEPALPARCAASTREAGAGDAGAGDAGAGEAGAGDAGADAGDAGADAGAPDASPFDYGPLDSPRPTSLAFDDAQMILYVADDALPIIHVIDMSKPGAPRELAPLLATSLDEPTRKVSASGLALSPATSEFKRFLYAVDTKQGSLIVYDVTLGGASPREPMTRPHPELNPFQPIDRITFNAPVAAVSFVKHDWPLLQNKGQPITGKTGLICNPNPNAQTDPADLTTINQTDQGLGAAYRPNSGLIAVTLGPYRLRGVFGFATLSNGQIVTIDVDDWDAPCRRPYPLGRDDATGTSQPSALAPPEPSPTSPADLDPYHAPISTQKPTSRDAPITIPTTSLESFFPVSAPHAARSGFYMRSDPQTGIHVPNLTGIPQLVFQNSAKSTVGADGVNNPILLPTFSTLADPTYVKNPTEPEPARRISTIGPDPTLLLRPATPEFAMPLRDANDPKDKGNTTPGVRFSWEDPHVHIDQDWQVVYEGALPGFDGVDATMLQGDYQTLTLSVPNGQLCRRGVEDQALGNARIDAEIPELAAHGLPPYIDAHKWTGDYVQLADDILPPGNPYWYESGDDCWDPSLQPQPGQSVTQSIADARQSACFNTYGSINDTTVTPFRDFPILEAYDDHLVVGRFGYEDPANPATVNRQIVGNHPSNVAALKLMRCCFHHQSTFKVRTGGRWVALGSAVGYLHHITTGDGGRCVQSCDPRDQLLNARGADVPRPRPTDTMATPPDRNSPLAVRNPMFSFVVWSGSAATLAQSKFSGHTSSQRDMTWKLSTRGQFAPLQILLQATTTAVAPQSMRFIDSLGQLAVVDGASQGLVLIDLNSVGLAHPPYF